MVLAVMLCNAQPGVCQGWRSPVVIWGLGGKRASHLLQTNLPSLPY